MTFPPELIPASYIVFETQQRTQFRFTKFEFVNVQKFKMNQCLEDENNPVIIVHFKTRLLRHSKIVSFNL